MTFQNKVNLGPARGWHGDFASTRTRLNVYTGGEFNQDMFAAGEGGVNAGSFVWMDNDTCTFKNKGNGKPVGFVAREQNGLITQYLQTDSMLIPEGFMITAFEKGDFLILLSEDIGTVNRGDSVYVSSENGQIVDQSDSKAVETDYKYMENGKGGNLLAITGWV